MSDGAEEKLFLAEPFADRWRNKDIFFEIKKISEAANKADVYREKEGRRTLRFYFEGNSYFLKYHRGIGWKEILKNILQFRLPVLGATNEYRAARKLQSLGIDTLTPLAYACRNNNPGNQESFLITADLVNTTSLEDYCRYWEKSPPAFYLKQALIKKVALAAKCMHESGINHRDFYLCHFLLEKSAEEKIRYKQDFQCHLIDLHRCQIRSRVPLRWRIKDLGGLFYSALDIGLTRRDCYRFVKHYSGKSLRESLQDMLWVDVWKNARALYQKDFGKAPKRIFP